METYLFRKPLKTFAKKRGSGGGARPRRGVGLAPQV